MSTNILSQSHKRAIKVGNKIVGYLEGNRFIKSVIGSKHKLLKPEGWAIDSDIFDREVKPNATEIVVLDKETGTEYHCSVETFDRFKGELDRGFGRQYFLTMNHFEVRGDRKHRLGLWEVESDR